MSVLTTRTVTGTLVYCGTGRPSALSFFLWAPITLWIWCHVDFLGLAREELPVGQPDHDALDLGDGVHFSPLNPA
jgi:hypothetical protein